MKINAINNVNTLFKAEERRVQNEQTEAKESNIGSKDLMYGLGILASLAVATVAVVKHKNAKKELAEALTRETGLKDKLTGVKKELSTAKDQLDKANKKIKNLLEYAKTEMEGLNNEIKELKSVENARNISKAQLIERPSAEKLTPMERWSQNGRAVKLVEDTDRIAIRQTYETAYEDLGKRLTAEKAEAEQMAAKAKETKALKNAEAAKKAEDAEAKYRQGVERTLREHEERLKKTEEANQTNKVTKKTRARKQNKSQKSEAVNK